MVLDTTRDVVYKSLLAILGAITLADDELEQLLDRLAARGEQVARDRLSHVEAVRNRLIGEQSVTREIGHEGRVLQQTLQEEIERRGRMLAAALDLPTRDSINVLCEQVDQISMALDRFLVVRAPAAAPTGDGHAPVVGSIAIIASESPIEQAAAPPSEPEAMEAGAATVAGALAESVVAAPIESEAAEEGEATTTAEASDETAPVAGYEALNAKQAAALVETLDEATLHALREYEQAHRNRVTVLRAIELALARRNTPSA